MAPLRLSEFLLEGYNRIVEIENGIVNEAFELNNETNKAIEIENIKSKESNQRIPCFCL